MYIEKFDQGTPEETKQLIREEQRNLDSCRKGLDALYRDYARARDSGTKAHLAGLRQEAESQYNRVGKKLHRLSAEAKILYIRERIIPQLDALDDSGARFWEKQVRQLEGEVEFKEKIPDNSGYREYRW